MSLFSFSGRKSSGHRPTPTVIPTPVTMTISQFRGAFGSNFHVTELVHVPEGITIVQDPPPAKPAHPKPLVREINGEQYRVWPSLTGWWTIQKLDDYQRWEDTGSHQYGQRDAAYADLEAYEALIAEATGGDQ